MESSSHPEEMTTFKQRRRRKKRFLLACPTNFLKYFNLSNREQSTEIVVTRSNDEDLNLDFYPAENIFQKFPQNFKNKIFELMLRNKNKQIAIAILRKKDQSFKLIGPFYPKNKNGIMIHSEQQILKQIRRKFKQDEIKDYDELFIYSRKSPCLGREGSKTRYKKLSLRPSLINNLYKKKHKLPCMHALDCLSFILGYYYGIRVYVGFSEMYGCTGPITKVIREHKNDQCSQLGQALLTARKRILNVTDLQFPLLKLEQGNKNPLVEHVTINSPRNERSETVPAINKTIENIISGVPKAPQTREQWDRIKTQTAEELRRRIMDVMTKHSIKSYKKVCDEYIEEFKNTWSETLHKSFETCCDERLSDGINKEAVLLHMIDVKAFKHHPRFFHAPF